MADVSSTRAVRLLEMAGYLAVRNTLTSGPQIAKAFGLGLRTVYRDIADIRSMGLDIAGEAGSGYVLRQDKFIDWFLAKTLRNPRAGRRWQAVEAERLFAEAMENGND